MIKNYQIFKENINAVIQNSELDIGVVYFIMKDVYSDLEKMYYAQINKGLIEENNKQENNKIDATESKSH